MADAEPDKYRPRRAIAEPDPAPVAPSRDAADEDLADEDRPKPLYRDEVTGGSTLLTSAAGSGSGAAADPSPRSITFTPRRTRSADDDATTVLPRTSGRDRDEVDGFEDIDDDRHPLGQRTKLGLLVAAVAAVVVVGLAIGYAVLGVGKTPTTSTTPGPSVSASSDPSASSASTEPSANLLGDAVLLSVAEAGLVAKKSWKVASTQRGATENAAVPACFGPDPVEGQPTPQQRVLRLLSSSGKNAPGLLHEATAYASPEEAAQAYAVAAKTLGTCAVTGSYLFSGQTVSGVGDQATGVIVTSVDGDTDNEHTVVLSRTGRVMNIVDATQPEDKIAPAAVAQAAAAVVKRECAAAGGSCGGAVSVKDAPPPVGGDEPGFLATGDLPPAGKTPMPWVATPPELPKDDFLGSQCESVNWSTLSTKATTSRVYILQDSGSFFGLNDIVVTMKDPSTATKLVDKIKADLGSCEKRKLTAKVSDPEKVRGVGAQRSKVSGYTAEVSQRSTDGTKKYRVGIVAVGTKVCYTFLNPQDGFDFTDDQWDTVAVRAGQRVSQVN